MGRVVVAGSINMDVVATANRHPRIGETVAGHDILHFPGGKGANQAIAAARLGAPAVMVGRVGDDAFGQELKAYLAAERIDVTQVQMIGTHTGTAIITVANGDNTIVVVPGANATLGPEDVATVPFAAGDVAVSQFEIPHETAHAFLQKARHAGAKTILNPAPATAFGRPFLDSADVLILNETELGILARAEIRDAAAHNTIAAAAESLTTRSNQIICVTLGQRGLLALIDGHARIIPGRKTELVDTTGAGDCFVGAVAASIACGRSMLDAFAYANVAASISVGRMGASPSMPAADEVAAASNR